MQRSGVEWCSYRWSPITGCLGPTGKGPCSYCYAARMAKRFKKGFHPTLHPDRLSQPLTHKKPAVVFVCPCADLFGLGVKIAWTEKILLLMRQAPQHEFIVLTKVPQRASQFRMPPNVTFGVTATDQDSWDWAMRWLRERHAVGERKLFISAEPLIDGIDPDNRETPLSWLIIGRQTGPGARLYGTDRAWIDRLRGWIESKRIPLFEKYNLGFLNPVQEHPPWLESIMSGYDRSGARMR